MARSETARNTVDDIACDLWAPGPEVPLATGEAVGMIQTRRQGRCKFHDINTAPLDRVVGRRRQHAAKEDTCE